MVGDLPSFSVAPEALRVADENLARLGAAGLALGTACGSWLEWVLLRRALHRRTGARPRLGGGGWPGPCWREGSRAGWRGRCPTAARGARWRRWPSWPWCTWAVARAEPGGGDGPAGQLRGPSAAGSEGTGANGPVRTGAKPYNRPDWGVLTSAPPTPRFRRAQRPGTGRRRACGCSAGATCSTSRSPAAGWRPSGARTTTSSHGPSRSSCCTTTWPPTRTSASASAARPIAAAKLTHPHVVSLYDTGTRRRPRLPRHGVRRRRHAARGHGRPRAP